MGSIEFPLTQNEKKLRDLKNIHYGERCFILGNGPSLLKHDLSLLKNEITFGVNAIFLGFEDMNFKPTYYVIEDRFPAEDNRNEINSISDIIKIFPEDLRYCLKKDQNTININFSRYYAKWGDSNFPKFSKNIQKVAYWGGTVTYLNFQLAFYMGFSDVFLIGMDMNYQISDKVIGNIINATVEDENHFHPKYFGPGKRWHPPEMDRMFGCYEYAKQVYEESNRNIFNASIGGSLDVFERVDYLSLFNK